MDRLGKGQITGNSVLVLHLLSHLLYTVGGLFIPEKAKQALLLHSLAKLCKRPETSIDTASETC